MIYANKKLFIFIMEKNVRKMGYNGKICKIIEKSLVYWKKVLSLPYKINLTGKNIMNTENKKSIAEFLGAREVYDGEFEMYGIIEVINDGEDEQHFFKPDEMPFDSDWNWLMEVVERIEIDNSIEFYICQQRVNIAHNTDDSIETFIIVDITGTKKQAVYNACVEFIKWYNLNK